MLYRLMVQENKPIKQVVADKKLTRGAPVGGGAYLVDVPRNYNGINAVGDPNELAFETVAQNALYNRIPTVLGERYATTEVTAAGLTKGKFLKVESEKFVKAGSADDTEWLFDGEYPNALGVKMYIIEKIAKQKGAD